MSNPNRKTLLSALKRWRADPVAFCVEVLGFNPWSKQRELMRRIARSHYVACRSGHKVGKTTALAAIALWFIVCFERSRVVLTAPAAPQIERGIWAELDRLYKQASSLGRHLGGTLNETPWSGLKFADGRDVFGRSTNKKENFAGISAPNLLILVDEASGVPEEIFEAIFGNLGGNGRLVLISNPTQLSGRFYDVFHAKREHWDLVHISSEDTPNFHGESVPGLATPQWAAMMRSEWGYPSVHYDVRVLGNFPSQAENSVIGFELVEQAIQRGRFVKLFQEHPQSLTAEHSTAINALVRAAESSLLSLGVDVARFGDDWTVLAPARGPVLYEPTGLQSLDVVDVAQRAHAFARSLCASHEIPTLRVDANGLGAGVYDHVKRLQHVRAVEVNVSERASDPTRYVAKRDELWFSMRKWLEQGGTLPDHGRLASELIAPTYSFDTKNRYKVESKKELKARLGRSPDFADAACLAVYQSALPTGNVAGLRKLLHGRRL